MVGRTAVDSVHYADKGGLVKTVRALESLLPAPGTGITFLCIGSDLSTGDAFGPLTGTLLRRMGVPGVLGTLEHTVHAVNLEENLKLISRDTFIVAIDATMGHSREVGHIIFLNGPLRPGAAMQKNLPPVGDASVVFNVAPAGLANFALLGCASLNKVWQGANLLARGISLVCYRRNKPPARPGGMRKARPATSPRPGLHLAGPGKPADL